MVHPLPGGHFSDTFRQNVPAESPVNPLLSWCPLTGGVGGARVRTGRVARWRHGVGTHRCVYGMIQDVDVRGVSGGAQYPTVRDKDERDIY